MINNIVYSLIDDLNVLNGGAEQFIDKIEHMSTEEEKSENIKYKDMHYDREDYDLRRKGKENSVKGVEKLQMSMEGNSYKSVSKKIQFLMKNDMCMKNKYKKL